MSRCQAFLAAVADPRRAPIPSRVAVVVAHPDDETLGCGALLPRLDDRMVIHVTDGAPRNTEDARRHGFPDTQSYAAARTRELAQALALANVPDIAWVCLDVPDQGAASALADIARRLVAMVSDREVVLTHAYEGGHPDHDATAFVVHAAIRLIGAGAPAIVEMPFYRAGPDGAWLRQSFGTGAAKGGTILVLSDEERILKGRMLAAHATQADTLAGFGIADETYRPAPAYDFGRLPNNGDLLYERYGWGLTGARWLELVADARRELGLERRA